MIVWAFVFLLREVFLLGRFTCQKACSGFGIRSLVPSILTCHAYLRGLTSIGQRPGPAAGPLQRRAALYHLLRQAPHR